MCLPGPRFACAACPPAQCAVFVASEIDARTGAAIPRLAFPDSDLRLRGRRESCWRQGNHTTCFQSFFGVVVVVGVCAFEFKLEGCSSHRMARRRMQTSAAKKVQRGGAEYGGFASRRRLERLHRIKWRQQRRFGLVVEHCPLGRARTIGRPRRMWRRRIEGRGRTRRGFKLCVAGNGQNSGVLLVVNSLCNDVSPNKQNSSEEEYAYPNFVGVRLRSRARFVFERQGRTMVVLKELASGEGTARGRCLVYFVAAEQHPVPSSAVLARCRWRYAGGPPKKKNGAVRRVAPCNSRGIVVDRPVVDGLACSVHVGGAETRLRLRLGGLALLAWRPWDVALNTSPWCSVGMDLQSMGQRPCGTSGRAMVAGGRCLVGL
ncbi:hypothetical protein B0H16DRAFT_1483989 [Mycena metata]|uniref:Uncharacterized protein n=1 Tax=Mycena metata TaxID=1033252 RepID=A0AAD7DU40_9AGAR|nr:hypothetical protein B0H16DRAFT_1483989 [Mycena metata]